MKEKNEQNEQLSDKKREKLKIVLLSLDEGSSISKACKEARFSRTLLYEMRKKDKKLDAKILMIINSRTQVVVDALYKTAVEGNVAAQIFWLKNRASDRWKDKFDHGVKGDMVITVKAPKD